MLPGNFVRPTSDISIRPIGKFLCEFGNVVEIPLEGVGNLHRGLGIPQLEDRVVVEGPVLGLLVLAPDLLALDAEDLHPDSPRCGHVVRDQLRGQRRVAHDHVVGARFGEHALRKVCREVVVNDEFAHDALNDPFNGLSVSLSAASGADAELDGRG